MYNYCVVLKGGHVLVKVQYPGWTEAFTSEAWDCDILGFDLDEQEAENLAIAHYR